MKINKDLVSGLKQFITNRRTAGLDPTSRGAIRVDLKHSDHLHFEGFAKEGGNFTVQIDEPKERFGESKGPTPLNYFLIGGGSCLTMQWAKLAIVDDLKIDGIEAIIRGHTAGRGLDSYFTDFAFDVMLTGSEDEQKIKKVAVEAERLCYVHNTLKRAVPVASTVSLNGKIVYSSTFGPAKQIETLPQQSTS